MIDALAILFVVAGVVLAVAWAITDRPQKGAGFAAAGIAVLAGSALALRGPIAKLAAADASAREAAAARASADAQVLSDLRAQIEAQTASIAANAADAKRIAAEARTELSQAGRRLARLEELAARGSESTQRIAPVSKAQAAGGSPAQQDAPGLSVRQAEVLATSLRSSGANELTLTARSDDPETIEFAQRLKTAIEAGGWTVHGVNEAESARPVVGLEVRSPVPLPAHATKLLGALGRAGLQPKGSSREGVDELEVFVGSVPGKS